MRLKAFLLGILVFSVSDTFSQEKSKLQESDILSSVESRIDSELKKAIKDPAMRYATWGFALYDPEEDKMIMGYNESKPLVPASVNKLLTTYTAFSIFGRKHRWITQLEYSGGISQEGVLEGNLYVIGSGDPSLGSGSAGASSYNEIVKGFKNSIKELGITKINGNIIIESAVFKSLETILPPNIVWLEHNNYYLPVGNTKNVKPDSEQISIEARKTNLMGDRNYFYISPYTKKIIYTENFDVDGVLTGRMPIPPIHLANILRESLINNKISVSGKVVTRSVDTQPEKRVFLADYVSPTLEEIIDFTNQTSNNKFAEELLKISGFYSEGDLSSEAGKNSVVNHLKSIDFDFSGFSYADGSGLSRNNKATPTSHVKFLAHIMDKSYFQQYFNSLPIAGNTGTLRRMFLNKQANGKIFAKTGTLRRIKTLAGYIVTEKGKTLTFSLMINNYNGTESQIKRKMEQILEPAINL